MSKFTGKPGLCPSPFGRRWRRSARARKGEASREAPDEGFSLLVLVGLLSIVFAIPLGAQQPTQKQIWDGVFSAGQALRGKSAFDMNCARCHNLALTGSERGPAIKGATFLSHWEKDNLAGLFGKIRDTMPEGGPGTVRDEEKIDILSYILQQNGFPPGNEELKLDLPSLEDIRLAKKGIWDGVFTSTQADRGRAALLQNGCNGCHGADLTGGRGPALKGDRFITEWENGSLNRLFTKIRDTMPPLNAQQVTPADKLDIITYLLDVNGFPSGSTTLTMDDLDRLQITKRGAEAAGPANFSLVEVIGCLALGENKKWVVTDASDPVSTKDESSTPAALKAAEARPLGSQTFDLVSVSSSLNPESHKDHKVEVRGLLYRDTGYTELNVTSIDTVSSSCGK